MWGGVEFTKKKKLVQQKILEALSILDKEPHHAPKEPIGKDQYHLKLHPWHINTGVSVFLASMMMSEGSTPSVAGEVDLYKLLQSYLLNPEFRKSVNELMKTHPLTKEHIKASLTQ